MPRWPAKHGCEYWTFQSYGRLLCWEKEHSLVPSSITISVSSELAEWIDGKRTGNIFGRFMDFSRQDTRMCWIALLPSGVSVGLVDTSEECASYLYTASRMYMTSWEYWTPSWLILTTIRCRFSGRSNFIFRVNYEPSELLKITYPFAISEASLISRKLF